MASPVDSRLLQRASATRKFLVAGVVVGVATAALIIAQAWLLAHSITYVFASRTLSGIEWMFAALAAVFVGRAALAWLNQWLAARASAAVKSQLRSDIVRARLSRPTDTSASSAELVTLVTSGIDALDGYYSKYLPQLGLAVAVPLMVGATVLFTDWPSAIIVAFTLPLIPVFMALIGWVTEAATAKRYRMQTRLANHFADLVAGLPTLQVFGRARAQIKGLENTERAHRRETMRTLSISFLSAGVLELLATISVAVVAVTVGFRLVDGHIDFTTALFVLILAPEAFLPVRQVGVHYHDAADGVAAADRAFAIIEAAEVSAPVAGRTGGDALVVFEGASFTYPNAPHASLAPLDLRVRRGEVVALAGASGSGKTTALSLLMGFLTPTQGRLSFADTDLAAWRRRTAWVAQVPGMISGTVADNVRIGFPDATDGQITDALARVGADFGADRTVGDDGEGLSAGERRRVALARALLRIELAGAELLVLDEPTAGLDAETEARVLDAVKTSGAGAVIVSHRAAVLDRADRTVHLDAAEVTA